MTEKVIWFNICIFIPEFFKLQANSGDLKTLFFLVQERLSGYVYRVVYCIQLMGMSKCTYKVYIARFLIRQTIRYLHIRVACASLHSTHEQVQMYKADNTRFLIRLTIRYLRIHEKRHPIFSFVSQMYRGEQLFSVKDKKQKESKSERQLQRERQLQ